MSETKTTHLPRAKTPEEVGVSSRVLKELLHDFDRLGLNRLEISASVTNAKSAAVATRAGFTPEGTCREYEFINGKFVDHVRFSLLARDLK